MKNSRTQAAVNAAPSVTRQKHVSTSTRLLPSLVAGGACSLLASPAMALQLSDIDVRSGLGQPLRASIAFALSPNEQLHDYCIFLRPAGGGTGLPAIREARLSIVDGSILIEGVSPVREPMVSIALAVDCPYTANLARSYTLMLDPVPEPVVQREAAVEPVPAARPESAPAIRQRPTPVANTSVAPSNTYRVRPGDSLSTIVSRIENRELDLWNAVERVFAANPDAFINGDMNMLKAGSVLTIPSLDGVSQARVSPIDSPAAAAPTAESPAETTGSSATVEYNGVVDTDESTLSATTSIDADAIESSTAAVADTESAVVTETTLFDQTVDLSPGDVSFGTAPAFVEPIGPAASDNASSSQGASTAPTAEQTTAFSGDTSGGLLYWLIGAGLAIFGGLMFFGRRFRREETPPPVVDNELTAQNEAVSEVDVDFSSDDPVTAFHGRLDADLAAGTGFDSSQDVEVAQDFAFSTTRDLGADLDLVLPEVTETVDADTSSTDILPTHRVEEQTILDREILPTDDDEYDLSMIVDATKQRYAEDGDVPAKELEAVPVDDEAVAEDDEDYTLSNEVDYQILEQDYEDELSATQALDAEIKRAAEDLAARLEADSDADTEEVAALAASDEESDEVTEEQTALLNADEMMSEDQADGATLEMPARDESSDTTIKISQADEDDEVIEGGDRTAEIPAAETESRRRLDETMASTQLTEALPAAQNDATAELNVESGHFRTRKTAN